MKEHWKIIVFTLLSFLQLARNLSSLNDELNPSLKLLSIGGIGLLVLSSLSSLFQMITSVSDKFQLSRENFKIGACVWLFVNVCAALWGFIHSSFLTMKAFQSSSETTTAEILLEAKRVETKTAREEEITAIEEAEILAPDEQGAAPANTFLISWLFTIVFSTLVGLIALKLMKKAKEEDEIYKEKNVREIKKSEPSISEKKISSDSNDIGYWSDSTPGTSSNTSIAEKVAASSSNQFNQTDANSTRQYTEIEEDSFRIQMDVRGAKEDLMNRCCIMPNEAKYPLPNRVEQLKGKKRRAIPTEIKYEESQQYDWRKSLPRNATDKRVDGESSGNVTGPYGDQTKSQKLDGTQLASFAESETLSASALQAQLDKIKRLEEKLNKALTLPQKSACDSSATISSGSITSEAVDPSNPPSERTDSNARIYMENHSLKHPAHLSSASFSSSRRSTLNKHHKKTVRWRNFKEEFEFYGDITVQKRNRPEDKEDA